MTTAARPVRLKWSKINAIAPRRAAGYVDELLVLALESNADNVLVDADGAAWKAFVAKHARCDNCQGAHRSRECPIPLAFKPGDYGLDSGGTDPCSC